MKFKYNDTIQKDAIHIIFTKKKVNRFVCTDKMDILEMRIGDSKEMTGKKTILFFRQIITTAKQYRLKNIVIDVKDLKFKDKFKDDELGELLSTNMLMAGYAFNKFKTEPKEGWGNIESVALLDVSKNLQDGIKRGEIIAKGLNNCRDLANTPAGLMTPEILADTTKILAKGTGVRVKVLDVDDMKILKMGAVLAVGQGSVHEPRFIVLEYFGAKNKKEAPVILVGKGVTFDSGGLSLKPADYMTDMHHDMAGGASVINTVLTCARLGVKRNLVALIPTVENMPSGSSYHPGDVIRTMSGQTIEILNTDAEGRVILADALTYASKYKPKLVIDVATLTGAAMVALGTHNNAIFTSETKIADQLCAIGQDIFDPVWPLPMGEEYTNEIKGTFGDWANLGKTRYGGAIQGAVFLQQFIKDYPWVHIDIAPMMTSVEGQYLAKGASGTAVRLLIKYLENEK